MEISSQLNCSQQVSWGAERLANELREFRDRVLPQLIERSEPAYDAFVCAAMAMADSADALAWSVRNPDALCSAEHPYFDAATPDQVRKAIRLVHNARKPQAEAIGEIWPVTQYDLEGFQWDGKRIVWSLWAMIVNLPDEALDDASRFIGEWLGIDVKRTVDLRQVLRDLPLRRLLKVLRRMPFGKYMWAVESLMRIDPTLPDAIFLVPTNKHGPALSSRNFPKSYATTNIVSYLLGAAMEIRANNHFGMVWRTALRPETRGNWLSHMPYQVLEILYRKWQVLHIMAEQKVDMPLIVAGK